MQSEKKAIPFFRLDRWMSIAAGALVFLIGSAYAQDLRQRQLDGENLFSAAIAAEQRNDPIEAELRYEECREFAQTHRLSKMESAAAHRLAVIKARNNKFTESANLFRRAIELDPKNALILCDFARLYADRKDFGEAELILKNALSFDPNNPKVLYNLGIVTATQHGERQAEGLRYLKLAVGEADAYRELARIYRSKGDSVRAEFAEQKAQMAGTQRPGEQETANGVSASTSADWNDATIRPSQSATRQSQTPPEVVNRIRDELVMREVVEEAQRNANTSVFAPPVPQTPFAPTSANPSQATATNAGEVFSIFPLPPITAMTTQVAATVPQPQSLPEQTVVNTAPQTPPAFGPPVNPFATIAKQQEASPVSVRRLEPPPIEAITTQSAVRALPRHDESLPVSQRGNPVPVQVAESKPANDDSSAPQLVKIASSAATGSNQFQRTLPKRDLDSNDIVRHISLPPARSNDKRAERISTVNPLRQIPADRADLIDPVGETSLIAALPSYSAAETRKIPRIDQNELPKRTEDVPAPIEPLPGGIVALRPIESSTEARVAQAPRPLPVRDIDVLQPPSAVIASQEEVTFPSAAIPSSPLHTAKTSAIQSPQPEPTRMIQGVRPFGTVTTPDTVAFVSPRQNPPPNISADTIPAELPVEIAARPLEPSPPVPTAFLPIQLPQITGANSDFPKVATTNVTPTTPQAPAIVFTDPPFPIQVEPSQLAGTERSDPQPMALPVTIPADSIPTRGEPPKLAMAKRNDVQPSVLPTIELAEPFLRPSHAPLPSEARVVPPAPSPAPTQELAVKTPPQGESAGFASTRKPGREVEASGNGSTGFAQSRK